MSCVWMLQRGNSGDGCVLASTLCRYDLRKGDLFIADDICYYLSSVVISVRVPESGVCVHISGED